MEMDVGTLRWTMYGLLGLLGVCGLACFALVVVGMFRRGLNALGVTSLLLAPFVVGFLIAFVVGWAKAREWNLRKAMRAWTVLVAAQLVVAGLFGAGVYYLSSQESPEQAAHRKRMEEMERQLPSSAGASDSKTDASKPESSKDAPVDPFDVKIEIP